MNQHARTPLLIAALLALASPLAAQSDTVRLQGVGRADTTCFVFPEDGGPVTASRCAVPELPPTELLSHAFGRWAPSAPGECAKELHDSYSVIGPDGKRYPTWHPPVDPSGCYFGHEHGRDPSGSKAADGVELAFGYANEVLMEAGGPTQMRHEDHVGHKVEWINDVPITLGTEATTCHILVKLHQGTHSKDAFTNGVHEIIYLARCDNGLDVRVQAMTAIGPSGEFTESCNLSNRILVGAAVPADAPNGDGDSRRRVPTSACVEQGRISEQWSTFTTIRRASGGLLADFNPYMVIGNPSRVYDASLPGLVARPIEGCHAGLAALASACTGVTPDVTWDDPRSPFRGDRHDTKFNRLTVVADDIDVWYTDAYGKQGSPTPFPNSIAQVLRGSTAAGRYGRITYLGSRQGDFHAPGVRAPN